MIPLLILIATIASIIRVLAFFIHGDWDELCLRN
jgi:hypothetical protein